ncbi:hypothetical protein [Baaleninema sp.]|uniref:hypothetical protein n=1 Tax=Baaleninema sp. TaxID=3101197 RepID=UPI003CFFFEAD
MFELRTQLQTLLWSVELLEIRLNSPKSQAEDRQYLHTQIQQVRETVERTCALLDRPGRSHYDCGTTDETASLDTLSP